MALKLLAALILGALIGIERERHDRPAGLRTHILVCLASTLLTLISESYGTGGERSRISAQIVSGIGFLGAGTIMRHGNVVRGLTTAASLWAVAGIGIAVARGGVFLALAVVATALSYLTLALLNRLETRLKGRRREQELMLQYQTQPGRMDELLQTVDSPDSRVLSYRRESAGVPSVEQASISLEMGNPARRKDLLHALSRLDWVLQVEWM
jgi:putative Mg2+ transporter-C (MgtC) family protein